MRRVVKWGLLAAVLTVMGTSTARAWYVDGTLVCAGTTDGVASAQLKFVQGSNWYLATSDANGYFLFHIEMGAGSIGTWDVFLNVEGGFQPLGQVFIGGPPAYGVPYTITPAIQVSESLVPACGPPPPPPVCEELQGREEGFFCPARPLGNPQKECAFFGLVPIGKDDYSSSSATMNADLALVKAGSCYRVYLGVTVGDGFESPPDAGAISHVTYCACPPE